MKNKPVPKIVGFGWYKDEGDYQRLLSVSDDAADLADAFEEWRISAERAFKNFIDKGYFAVKVEVDIDELIEFCKSTNRKINGESRAEFAAKKAAERFEPE